MLLLDSSIANNTIEKEEEEEKKKKNLHVLKGYVTFTTAQLLPPPIGSALFQ